MKKLIVVVSVVLFLSAGCASRKVIKHEFAYSDYNRFMSATLMALNERNFSIETADASLGLIKAVDYSTYYTKMVFGLYWLLPGIYTEPDHPRASIVIQKGQDKMIITANIATNTSMTTEIDTIIDGIDFWYQMYEKNKRLAKKAAVSEPAPVKTTQGINPYLNYPSSIEIEITNTDNFGWNNVLISLVYLEKGAFNEYSKAVQNIEQGRTISVKKEEFKDIRGKKLDNYEKPDRVSIQCRTMKGEFQWSGK